jgi:hypothetical protein
VRVLLRVPGCLALVPGLLLCGSGTSSGAAGQADPPRVLPLPPSGVRGGGAQVAARVSPADTLVGPDENADFTLSLTDVGAAPAYNVRVLLDGVGPGDEVGSADGRCLSRLDASSPADLWCDLGDVAPRGTVSVTVHAFRGACTDADRTAPAPRSPAAAFRWRVGYLDGDDPRTVDGPAPQWSCAAGRADDGA